jgi:hypothetical protein
MNRCLFCSGDAASPEHFKYCDGRQGRFEAALEEPLYGHQGDVPYEVSSATSAAAAATLTETETLSRLEARVLAVVTERPRTCDAVEIVTGLSHQTVSARLRGLVLREQIENSGQKALTRSGRWAVVWRRHEGDRDSH